jgi:general secretion pathway protein A
MDYFQLLRLNKEPFSNSPNPEFFYPSKQHATCLQKLEIAIRLKRGLNVIIGDVGTGKTTLCRHLVRRFAKESNVQINLILDPTFKNKFEFLTEVARLLGLISEDETTDEWTIKERIKKYLYTEGVDQEKIITIIIDEGQKIPYFALEILREFLNYETNEYKLLQIVIFAQKEFKSVLNQHANFSDRINICHELGPLNFLDTVRKIRFRLDKASEGRETPNIFTWPAFWAVYRATAGYPRKILHLCHLVLLALIIQNNTRANYFLVRSCIKRDSSGRYYQTGLPKMLFIVLLCIGFAWGYLKIQSININSLLPETFNQWISVSNKTKMTGGDQVTNSFKTISSELDSIQTNKKDKSPIILGKINCLQNESLKDLIQMFYGTFNPWYLRYVRMVNPQIKDSMTIERGQKLYFPGVPVTASSKKRNFNELFWIEIARFNGIHEAYGYFINYPNDAPKIFISSYWNKKEGLTFSILYDIPFDHEDAATQFIKQFPKFIAKNCRIRNHWENETTFFSKRIVDLIDQR